MTEKGELFTGDLRPRAGFSRPADWRPAQKLSPTQWEEVIGRYQDGESSIDLATEYGVSAHSIRNRSGRRD